MSINQNESGSSGGLAELTRLLDAAYELRRQIDSWARGSYGLPLLQLMTVLAIARLDGAANVSEIARAVRRKSHTITVAVDTLERKGLVTRTRTSDGDRRKVTVRLTSAGRRLAMDKRPDEHFADLPVSDGEQEHVREVADLLEKLGESKS